jgi:uncharacterized membrane protein
MTKEIAWVVLWTVLPISELRGGIPVGILRYGLDPWLVFSLAVITNILVFFPVFFGLRLFYVKVLSRIPFFDRYLNSVWTRGKPAVDKYGFWGLTLLVAVPLPITGVYTGTALAWLLGMDWKKAFPATSLGAVVAGVIVLLVTLAGAGLL